MRRYGSSARRKLTHTALLVAGLSGLAGCQVDVGGQTLPSSHYLDDDVQYFRPNAEFMLSNEAAAMEQYSAPAPAPAP